MDHAFGPEREESGPVMAGIIGPGREKFGCTDIGKCLRCSKKPSEPSFYCVEAPACIQDFLKWRDQAHDEKTLHTCLLACRGMMYLLHIYIFLFGEHAAAPALDVLRV